MIWYKHSKYILREKDMVQSLQLVSSISLYRQFQCIDFFQFQVGNEIALLAALWTIEHAYMTYIYRNKIFKPGKRVILFPHRFNLCGNRTALLSGVICRNES